MKQLITVAKVITKGFLTTQNWSADIVSTPKSNRKGNAVLSRRSFGLGLAATSSLITKGSAQTQWPTQVVKFVVPFPAGNTADTVARILQPGLAKRLGHPVVVENRAGAGGAIGADSVAKATDQHTFLLTTASPIVINPALYKSLAYNVDRDFAPIMKIGSVGVVLIGNRDLPASTISELVAHIRENPGKLNYASVGIGSFAHLTMELFRRQLDLDIQHIPLRGTSAAHVEIIGGRIQLLFDSLAAANAQVRTGTVKAFAVASAERSGFAPDVPTLAESNLPGLKDFDISVWIGLFGPSSKPRDLSSRLEAAVRAELSNAEIVAKLHQQSIAVQISSTTGEFAKMIKGETDRWTAVAREINIQGGSE